MAAAEAAMEPRGLPPGVYFNPAPEECVNDYLLPWARGERLPELGRYIHEESIYRQGPDALRLAHAPGTTRAFEPKWYFLSRCKKRGGRAVATGGTWTVEQKQRILDGGEGGDDDLLPGATRKSFGFFLGERKTRKKTPWLMEEFTAGDGACGEEKDAEVPVLCRIYVSPRATNDEKRAIFGEAGVAVDADRKKKPERVVIPADQFDALAKLLPKSCRRRLNFVGKGQQAAPSPPPPDVHGHHHAPPPPAFLAPQIINPTAPAPPPVLLGRQRSQAAPPPAVLGPHHSQPVRQPNVVPVRRHGHPLPPSPRPEAHRSAPSSAESSTRQQEEAAIRPAKRARPTPHHAPPQSQDTGMDALQSETLQETPPPLPQEMLPFDDACHAADEPFRGSFMDLLASADDDGFDFGKFCEISNQQQMDDGEPLPDIPLDVEFFSTAEFTGFQHPT